MLRIRQAGVDDADQVTVVHTKSWVATYRDLVPYGALSLPDPQAWAARFREYLREGRTTLLAIDGPEPVGMISFGQGRDDPDFSEVYALYVLPERQGQRIGRQLLNAALASLVPTPVMLRCAAENWQARRFYETHGFVANGAAKPYRIGETDCFTVRYALSASPRRSNAN